MQNNKFWGLIILVLIVIGAIYIFSSGRTGGADILSETARVYTYTYDDVATDYGFIEVNFEKSPSGVWYANGLVDANNDGVFADSEWVVKNNQAVVQAGYANRFSFVLADELKTNTAENISVSFSLTVSKVTTPADITEKDALVFNATRETVPVVEQFGLNVPGASEDLKRGVNVVYAQDFDSGIEGNIPDLTGGPMDCFAIATANNLINMAQQNGRRDDLPANPQDLINELKQDMQFNDGILNRNFMPGKAAFVARYNLPIETREIRRPTVDDLEEAFSSGDAVEISTTMLRSRSNRATTGHVLTGTGAFRDGDDGGISVHDPATPEGADIYELSQTGGDNPYLMINYPMWDGIVIIDAIYIQNWNQPATTDTEKSSGAQVEAEPSTTAGQNISTTPEPESVYNPDYNIEATFAHVKPGEYSEIYSVVTGLQPGQEVEVWLYDQSSQGKKKYGVADANGTVHHTWTIYSYGTYEVTAQAPNGVVLEAKVAVN